MAYGRACCPQRAGAVADGWDSHPYLHLTKQRDYCNPLSQRERDCGERVNVNDLGRDPGAGLSWVWVDRSLFAAWIVTQKNKGR